MHSEVHFLSCTIYVTNTDMVVGTEINIKRGQNYSKSGHVDSCSRVKGELVGSVS